MGHYAVELSSTEEAQRKTFNVAKWSAKSKDLVHFQLAVKTDNGDRQSIRM